MANWMTAEELSDRYLVGEERLLSYSARGNLAFRKMADGVTLFDESAVARFFKPRGASGVSSIALSPASHLAILGVSRLGERATATPVTGRSVRRRAIRVESSAAPQEREHVLPRRAAG